MRTIVYFVAGTIALLFGVYVFFTLIGVLHAWIVPTGSMSPTIMPGDHIFSENLSYRFRKPRRGDIVVFKISGINGIDDPEMPSESFYSEKRIIGLPGDTLQMRFELVLVNGMPDPVVTELKISPGRMYLKNDDVPVLVPRDAYFVVGDNTRNSFDSRYWGFLPAKNITGRAFFTYWPLSRFGPL